MYTFCKLCCENNNYYLSTNLPKRYIWNISDIYQIGMKTMSPIVTFVNCGFWGRCGVASRLDPKGMGLRAPTEGLRDIGDGEADSSMAEGAEK